VFILSILFSVHYISVAAVWRIKFIIMQRAVYATNVCTVAGQSQATSVWNRQSSWVNVWLIQCDLYLLNVYPTTGGRHFSVPHIARTDKLKKEELKILKNDKHKKTKADKSISVNHSSIFMPTLYHITLTSLGLIISRWPAS